MAKMMLPRARARIYKYGVVGGGWEMFGGVEFFSYLCRRIVGFGDVWGGWDGVCMV